MDGQTGRGGSLEVAETLKYSDGKGRFAILIVIYSCNAVSPSTRYNQLRVIVVDSLSALWPFGLRHREIAVTHDKLG